jgi:hypothetical protein
LRFCENQNEKIGHRHSLDCSPVGDSMPANQAKFGGTVIQGAFPHGLPPVLQALMAVPTLNPNPAKAPLPFAGQSVQAKSAGPAKVITPPPVRFPNQSTPTVQPKPAAVTPAKSPTRFTVPLPTPVAPPKVAAPAAAQAKAVQLSGGGQAFQVPPTLNLTNLAGGQRLPEAVQKKMEAFFGTSFDDVRVHVGPQAASIGALAFTHGTNLYFAPGQYNPTTTQGQQLLGHELTHVVQQRVHRVRNPFGAGIAVVQDRRLEAEAERMAPLAAAHEMPLQGKMSAFATVTPTTTQKPGVYGGNRHALEPQAMRCAAVLQRHITVGEPYELGTLIERMKAEESVVWHDEYIPILKELDTANSTFPTLSDLLLRLGGILVAQSSLGGKRELVPDSDAGYIPIYGPTPSKEPKGVFVLYRTMSANGIQRILRSLSLGKGPGLGNKRHKETRIPVGENFFATDLDYATMYTTKGKRNKKGTFTVRFGLKSDIRETLLVNPEFARAHESAFKTPGVEKLKKMRPGERGTVIVKDESLKKGSLKTSRNYGIRDTENPEAENNPYTIFNKAIISINLIGKWEDLTPDLVAMLVQSL